MLIKRIKSLNMQGDELHMDVKTLVFYGILIWLPSSVVFSQTTHVDLVKIEDMVKPDTLKSQGYLLIYLDVQGVAPSIEFKRLGSLKSSLTIDLKDLDSGYYSMLLPVGRYQIEQIKAPFYDYPYKLSTKQNASWQFVIKDNKTNFIGELNVANLRMINSIDVNLYNRFATHQKDIHTAMSSFLIAYPLVNGTGPRDDFAKELRRK